VRFEAAIVALRSCCSTPHIAADCGILQELVTLRGRKVGRNAFLQLVRPIQTRIAAEPD